MSKNKVCGIDCGCTNHCEADFRSLPQHTPESKLEQAAETYLCLQMEIKENLFDLKDDIKKMLVDFTSYWQSLTTPVWNEVEGELFNAAVEFLNCHDKGYTNHAGTKVYRNLKSAIDKCKKDTRKPHTVEEGQSGEGDAVDGWTNKKPIFETEGDFVTASWWKDHWEYKIWSIVKIYGYLALCNEDGDEWGDYEDLTADMYYILPKPQTRRQN